MFAHRDLARGASDLSPNLTRDDKARLWAELTCRLNHLGPPRSTERWKRVWMNRVCKARKRCAVVEAER
uniref:Regulatory protein zeste n=1 Tax=Ixodes ricinus TaxID=34613 RepID=A0A147BLF9_IXORI